MSDETKELVSTDPLACIPQVRVLDENGREVLRGWYAFHEKRQLCPMGYDELRPDDVQHLVIHSDWADWNMPRRLVVSEITPPHRIVPVEQMPSGIVRCSECGHRYADGFCEIFERHTPENGYCYLGIRGGE